MLTEFKTSIVRQFLENKIEFYIIFHTYIIYFNKVSQVLNESWMQERVYKNEAK